MKKQEQYKIRKDGVVLIRTWSDMDMMLRQVASGELYGEAIDPESEHRDYEETDIPIGDETWKAGVV